MGLEILLVLLGFSKDLLNSLSQDKVKELISKIRNTTLADLFINSFYNSLDKHGKNYGHPVKALKKAIKKDEAAFLALFTSEATNYNSVVAAIQDESFHRSLAVKIVEQFNAEENYKDVMVLIISGCLENYKLEFYKTMTEKEGIELSLTMHETALSQLQKIMEKLDGLSPPKPKQPKPRKKRERRKQIKILSITASPEDDILYEQEQDTLLDAFKSFDRNEVFLDMPDPVKSTLEEIGERLKEDKHDVLHISAHGGISDTGDGILSFENYHGGPEPVSGSQLADVLKETHMPCIVILSSCHSARKEPKLMPVARTLFKAGVPVVIGMNKAITQLAAIDFTEAFFKKLCGRCKVNTAFKAGLDAIREKEPQRLKENPGWPMNEYEIPQLLGDKTLTASAFSTRRIEAPGRPQSHHFLGAKYLERGFIGRRNILREIFKAIEKQEGALVLKGPGGIGKSTLTTRAAANLRRQGYRFIVIHGETSVEEILQAISTKAVEFKVRDAEHVNSQEWEPERKLSWFLEHFLLKRPCVLIFDNFELNQDEGAGDFKADKQQLKTFLYHFRECLKNKETFLLFSTRYTLPGFDSPDVTKNIPEFSPTELRKMLLNRKALKRLDETSVKTLRQEVGGNPRALELLDQIAYKKFEQRDFTWEELKALIPKLRERIIEKAGAADRFTPLFLDTLFQYLDEEQRKILDILSIYRNPVNEAAIETHGALMEEENREKLEDLSLMERTGEGNEDRYYVHRLTAQHLMAQMDSGKSKKYHVRAAEYFEALRTGEGKKEVMNDVEARWHFMEAEQWNRAVAITFYLEDYLSLHGSTQWAMELMEELPLDKLSEENRGISHNRLGILHQHFGDYDNALTHYQKSLVIDEKLGNEKDIAIDLHQVGMIHQMKGDYDAALDHYQKAKETFEKIGDIKGMANSLHQVGMIYEDRGDYDAALDHYQQSLEIAKKIGDTKGIAQGLHQVGIIHQMKGDYDAALDHYQQSLEIAKKIGDTKGIAQGLHQVGMIHQMKGDYDAALDHYQKAKDTLEKIGDIKGMATSLHQVGIIHQMKGDYASALDHYQQSLEIKEKIGDIKGMANSLHQVGMIHQMKGDYDAALDYYQQSLEIKEKIGDIKGMANSLHQVGRIYEERGDYASALDHYQQSLEITEKIGDTAGAAISMGQMGQLHFAKKEYEPALRYGIQAFLIFDKIGSHYVNLTKQDIDRIREKMPQQQFEAILQEFGIPADVFD